MILRTKISKKMKLTGAALLGFLLLFLLFCGLSENQDWIARHFQVKVPVNNRWQELDIHLMHSNENNRLSDGVLFFSSWPRFLAMYPAPQIMPVDQRCYLISHDAYVDSLESWVDFYEVQGDDLDKMKKEKGDSINVHDLQQLFRTSSNIQFVRLTNQDGTKKQLNDLPPGLFLMELEVHATHRNKYFSGKGFAWVAIEN